MIPHNKPSLGIDESMAIEEVISSGWISNGKKVNEFEDKVSNYIGLSNNTGVAVSSGTSALYLALKILNVGGGEVICPTYVCSALLNAIDMVGAIPVITDINSSDLNFSVTQIKNKISKKTRAIIVPHIFGFPADIVSMKDNFDIPIIEDCATTLGSKINNKHLGTFGDLTVFSFYATKVITTGHGGMIVSNNSEHVDKLRDFINYDGRKDYHFRFNFQMSDIQATMGLTQLKKLENLLRNRKKIADSYINICEQNGWDYQNSSDHKFLPNWYRFVLKSKPDFIIKLKNYLESNGVHATIPIENWELLHNYLKLNKDSYEIAESLSRKTLSLPIYPDLINEGNLDIILNLLNNFNT